MRLAVMTGTAGDHLDRIPYRTTTGVKKFLIQFQGHTHHGTGYLLLGLFVAGIIGTPRLIILLMAERTGDPQLVLELIYHDPVQLLRRNVLWQYLQVLIGISGRGRSGPGSGNAGEEGDGHTGDHTKLALKQHSIKLALSVMDG